MSQVLQQNCIGKTEGNKEHTHTWFGSGVYPRKVSLTDSNHVEVLRQKLFNQIKKDKSGLLKWNAITEKISATKPFVFFADIDFKPEDVCDKPNLQQDMVRFLELYRYTVEECHGEPVKEWYVASRMSYKFHLYFPTVIVTKKIAEDISRQFVENLKLHDTLNIYYKEHANDMSVYKTGLRMLWCHKGSMIKQDKLQQLMKEHVEKLPKMPYEHSYFLVNPVNLDERLELDISHLALTSIHTKIPLSCHYKNRNDTSLQETALVEHENDNINSGDVVERQNYIVEELAVETQHMVRNEITTLFTCWNHEDISKIINFENYLVAAIAKRNCPLKGSEHSKNHPYVVICSNGIRLKCHNIICKKKYNKLYPISVQLQKALEECGKRLTPHAEGYLIKNVLSNIYIPQWTPDLQSAFTAYLNNYVAMFLGNGGIAYLYRITPDAPWNIYSKEKIREVLSKYNTHVSYVNDDGVKRIVPIRIFETWTTNINRREISKIVLDSNYMGDDPEDPSIWNVWSGFKVKASHIVDLELIEPVLHHIKRVYCGDDDKKYKAFMDWITHLVKEPSMKIGTAIILRGSQGTGKNIVLDWFGRKVIGNHYHEYNSMEDMMNRFNSDSEYKIFSVCNEISNYGGCIKTNDMLKNKITNTYSRIERKGVDAIGSEDFQNFIFTTNNSWVVRISPDDRRYVVMETSDVYKGNATYFKNLADCLKNVQVAQQFLGYLFSRELNCVCGGQHVRDENSPLVNVHEAIWTQEKIDLLSMSKESLTSFIDRLMCREVTISSAIVMSDGRLKVSNAELYRAYCTFHDENNFFSKKLDIESFSPSFRKEMLRYPERFEKKSVGPKDSRARGWAIKTS